MLQGDFIRSSEQIVQKPQVQDLKSSQINYTTPSLIQIDHPAYFELYQNTIDLDLYWFNSFPQGPILHLEMQGLRILEKNSNSILVTLMNLNNQQKRTKFQCFSRFFMDDNYYSLSNYVIRYQLWYFIIFWLIIKLTLIFKNHIQLDTFYFK